MSDETSSDVRMHASLARMYELAREDFDIRGPAALARKLGETTQAVNNWTRGRGVSNKGAMNAQRLLGWSAEYIVSGRGPRRLKPTLSEVIGAPVEVPPTMLTYARVKGELRPYRQGVEGEPDSMPGLVMLDESVEEEKYVLVFFDGGKERLEAYKVGKGALINSPRVLEGEFLVVNLSVAPQQNDEVLVCYDKGGVKHWELETFAMTFEGRHYFKDPADPIRRIKQLDVADDMRVVVAINSKRSAIEAPKEAKTDEQDV